MNRPTIFGAVVSTMVLMATAITTYFTTNALTPPPPTATITTTTTTTITITTIPATVTVAAAAPAAGCDDVFNHAVLLPFIQLAALLVGLLPAAAPAVDAVVRSATTLEASFPGIVALVRQMFGVGLALLAWRTLSWVRKSLVALLVPDRVEPRSQEGTPGLAAGLEKTKGEQDTSSVDHVIVHVDDCMRMGDRLVLLQMLEGTGSVSPSFMDVASSIEVNLSEG